MAGKGDKPRPLSVPADEFERRWKETFGDWGKAAFVSESETFGAVASDPNRSGCTTGPEAEG